MRMHASILYTFFTRSISTIWMYKKKQNHYEMIISTVQNMYKNIFEYEMQLNFMNLSDFVKA